MSPPRFPWEIRQEMHEVARELKNTPSGSPNVGHLATIMVGLQGELEESKRAWQPAAIFPLPLVPRWLLGRK